MHTVQCRAFLFLWTETSHQKSKFTRGVEDHETVVHLRPRALLVGFLQRVAAKVELCAHIKPVVPLHAHLVPQHHGDAATLVGHLKVGLGISRNVGNIMTINCNKISFYSLAALYRRLDL